MEHGAWSMEHGAWSMEHGAWSMEHGAWSMEHGAWSVGLHLRLSVLFWILGLGCVQWQNAIRYAFVLDYACNVKNVT
jgi:hypothetical protein